MCVCEGVVRHRVGGVVGRTESAVLLHFFNLLGKDGGDVVRLSFWDVYVESEGASRCRVVGVDAREVEVVDKLRCVDWRDRGESQGALEV